MKDFEFYSKYKTSYPPIVNPIFSKGNWWRIVLVTVVAVLIGPLMMYKHQKQVVFSFDYYFRLLGYSLLVFVPFISFLIVANRRALAKRSKGYGWVGKFEVINKHSSFGFHYLLLAPGNHHQIKVDGNLFEKISPGDFVRVRRDALGAIVDISKIKNLSGRLAKATRPSR